MALALYSAATNRPLIQKLASLGEVSLAGEVRSVSHGQRRLKGASEMGFTTFLVPTNMEVEQNINIIRCSRIDEAIEKVNRLVSQPN